MNRNIFDLTGKVAVITGGASGLGKRMAQTLAAAGAAIAVADINESGAQEVAEALTKNGRAAIPIRMNVSDPNSVKQAVGQVMSEYKELTLA